MIVRNPQNGEITLYCKGADSAILTQLADSSDAARFGKKEINLQTMRTLHFDKEI